MYDDTSRGLESPVTTDDSVSNCPGCGALIKDVTTTGPGEHFASPCGCKVGAHSISDLGGVGERALADGGLPTNFEELPKEVQAELRSQVERANEEVQAAVADYLREREEGER